MTGTDLSDLILSPNKNLMALLRVVANILVFLFRNIEEKHGKEDVHY